MGIRENKVEKYLQDQVEKVLGGVCRKWVSPGHSGVMDQILFIPKLPVVFVEVKTVDGRSTPMQVREFNRLVRTEVKALFKYVHGEKEVDMLINYLQCLRDNKC